MNRIPLNRIPYNGTPYWVLGKIQAPGDMRGMNLIIKNIITKKPEKLEEDLIGFVNEHSKIFNPEDMERMRRAIIRAFAMFSMPFISTEYNRSKPGLSCIAQFILQTIYKIREIYTSQEVKDALTNFDVCVEFIDKFLTALCETEESYTQSGFLGSNKWQCEQIEYAVYRDWPHDYPNIFRGFEMQINRYHSRVLKLWADVLIHEGKITPKAIAKMQGAILGADGYEKKMRNLLAECGGGYSFKPNLGEPMLLKWLTLFHVEITKDPNMQNLTKKYSNGGRASTLDGIVFGIISQFVLTHNVHGVSSIPQSNKHESELNMLQLSCDVVERNSGQHSPVCAYLSSELLDQWVQSDGVGRFPTTDEFIKFLNTRMTEKLPPPPPPSPPPSPPSAPPLEMDDHPLEFRETLQSEISKLKNENAALNEMLDSHMKLAKQSRSPKGGSKRLKKSTSTRSRKYKHKYRRTRVRR